MKVINIEEIQETTPPDHHDLHSRHLVDATVGTRGLRTALVRMQPSGRSDPHLHENADHLFVILKGEMMIKTDQGDARLRKGQAAFIYPGEVHENYNTSEGETEYIVITCECIG